MCLLFAVKNANVVVVVRLVSLSFLRTLSGIYQVVGTHSLLSRKVEFPNLGLLVIDEEQKFGVNQKEKLKVREAFIVYCTSICLL